MENSRGRFAQVTSFFKPKHFETIGTKTIYSYLGINFFRKYLLLTDLVMFRFQKKKQFDSTRVNLAKEVKRLYWQTCRDETIHYIFMAVLALYVLINVSVLTSFQIVFVFFINLYTNIYPIFVQRHNRIRYEQFLTKYSK